MIQRTYPLISVIIPTYNRQVFLPKSISSVLKQTFQDFELIVVDDGSTDQTQAVLKKYQKYLRSIHQENRGPAAARNRGIKEARGKFLAFLDSDDCFVPEKLEVQLAEMEKEPRCLISHTDEVWYRKGQLLNQKKKHNKPSGYIYPSCLKMCVVGMSTVMVRREIFDLIGLFDENFPCCEDYDFWLRASVSLNYLKISEPFTVKYGGRPDQVSVKFRTGMDRFRIDSIVKLLKNEKLTAQQAKQAKAELSRKCRIYGNGCIKHGREEEGKHYLSLVDWPGL